MPPTYYPPVDPGGGATTQKASTAASALGFVALVGAEAGDQTAAALGLGAHSPQILSAGFSFMGQGSASLFTTGLVLVGLGILLNLISLGLKSRQASPSYQGGTVDTSVVANPSSTVVAKRDPAHTP